MKSITANPQNIRQIFTKKYIIPNFQRPYSWDLEQCEKLWTDILDFYEMRESKDDKYFLGNIVVTFTSEEKLDTLEVIDGQQRLTSLLLLIKAIHVRSKNWFDASVLESCLRIKDPITDKLTQHLRIDSRVIEEDKENLHALILHGVDKTPKCKFVDNYQFFEMAIDDWCKSSSTDDLSLTVALKDFILVLLDDILLLPIHCDSQSDALTIFETINNRGLSLSDADIFKARLYHHCAPIDQAAFINDWNVLKDHDWLFRVLMHIKRAESGNVTQEAGLRTFFMAKDSPLSTPNKTMNSLYLIDSIEQGEWFSSDEIACLWYIMDTYPNKYWKFPLYVFLHKHGSIDPKTNEFVLSGKMTMQFKELLEATVKYFFTKGILYNRLPPMRLATYRVCAKVEADEDYIQEYRSELFAAEADKVEIRLKLEKGNQSIPPRYFRGLVLLSAYLNPLQNKTDFRAFACSKFHIEHILPKKWNNYDGWTNTTWTDSIDTIGNCIPLERSLNIKAQNEFFNWKKEEYRKSTIQDARNLLNIEKWTPEEHREVNVEKVSRVLNFLRTLWDN